MNVSTKEFLKRIEELVDSEEYLWAEDTLLGIGETVENTGKVTQGQLDAVDNIENARR